MQNHQMFKILSYSYVSCDKKYYQINILENLDQVRSSIWHSTQSTTRLSSPRNYVIKRKMEEIYQWIETSRFLFFNLHLLVYFLRKQKTSSRFPTVSVDSCFRLFYACDFLFHIKIR